MYEIPEELIDEDPVTTSVRVFKGTPSSHNYWRKLFNSLCEITGDYSAAQSVWFDWISAKYNQFRQDGLPDSFPANPKYPQPGFHIWARTFSKFVRGMVDSMRGKQLAKLGGRQ